MWWRLVLLLLASESVLVTRCWTGDTDWLQPKQIVNATQTGLSFAGNRTEPDHFKLLERDGDYLLVGARDMVYNISVVDFSVQKSIVWSALENDVRECRMKGKSESDCHNYIRVLAKDNEQGVLVCGTNAFKPKCRLYSVDKSGAYVATTEFDGNAISPYDPSQNSSVVYLPDRREIFSATVSDFTGSDSLIYKHQLSKPTELGVRTERNEFKCLNEPNFVAGSSDDNFVYFWFRELAVEYMNCGKAVYSRVARVCQNDQGGSRGDKVWTSFLKARLNCSAPGDFPYYFDELEATSAVVMGQYGATKSSLVYAVFNTPYDSVRASAVCAYSMEDVNEIFSQGVFKSQPSPNANWMPILKSQVPSPRPGTCSGDSRQMSDEAAAFIKRNPLMDDAVPNFFQEPLLVQSTVRSRFTQIAVDPQVQTVDGYRYDVIFLGTDTGKLMKIVNVAAFRNVDTVTVDVVQLFDKRTAIENLLVYRSSGSKDSKKGSLIVVSVNEVRSVPLHYCSKASSCLACVRLQDPYCAWDTKKNVCTSEWSFKSLSNDGGFVQNVKTGRDDDRKCPSQEYERVAPNGDSESNNNAIDDGRLSSLSADDGGSTVLLPSPEATGANSLDENTVHLERIEQPSSLVAASQSQLAVAVVITLFVSLAIGFISGMLFSNRDKLRAKLLAQMAEEKLACKSINHAVGPASPGAVSANGGPKLVTPINAFEASPKFQDGQVPEVEIALGECDKTVDKNSVNNYNSFTLPKDYKTKKMYL